MILIERIFPGFMNKNELYVVALAGLFALIANGCQGAEFAAAADPMTTAYQMVLDHWQPANKGKTRRGYNIGAVLVGQDGRILAKELNAVIVNQDCTQHAEMRLIQGYIAKTKCFNLRGCSVYTTLEPCKMCAATMSMAGIVNVYYGQADSAFGENTAQALSGTGQQQYPRIARCIQLPSPLQDELEKSFKKSGIKEITKWLATEQAKAIFAKHLQKRL